MARMTDTLKIVNFKAQELYICMGHKSLLGTFKMDYHVDKVQCIRKMVKQNIIIEKIIFKLMVLNKSNLFLD